MKIAEGTFKGLAGSEVELFRTHLKGMKGLGVEIGCCDGYSSAVILDASELHLTSIDPFIPDSMEASLIGSRERYLENTEPYGDRARLIEGYSCSGSTMAQLGPQVFTFVFIDGDHTERAVREDFMLYSSILPRGGILAIHDARMSREGGANYHPGPSKVAKEQVFDRPDLWEVLGEAHSLVIARKR